jgi:hypothetical protein
MATHCDMGKPAAASVYFTNDTSFGSGAEAYEEACRGSRCEGRSNGFRLVYISLTVTEYDALSEWDRRCCLQCDAYSTSHTLQSFITTRWGDIMMVLK